MLYFTNNSSIIFLKKYLETQQPCITCDPNLNLFFLFFSEGGTTKNVEKCRAHFYYNLLRSGKPNLTSKDPSYASTS